MVLVGKVHFFSKRFGWLLLLVIRGFGKSCFQSLSKSKLCVKVGRVGSGVFSGKGFGKQAGYPTKRAPDAGDSAAFPSIFLRLSIFPIGRLRRPPPQRG